METQGPKFKSQHTCKKSAHDYGYTCILNIAVGRDRRVAGACWLLSGSGCIERHWMKGTRQEVIEQGILCTPLTFAHVLMCAHNCTPMPSSQLPKNKDIDYTISL